MKKSSKKPASTATGSPRKSAKTKAELQQESEELRARLQKLERSYERLKLKYKNFTQNESHYRELFSASQAPMLLIEPGTFRIADANNAACVFYGYDQDTLIGMSMTEINTLSVDEMRQTMAKALKKKKTHLVLRHRLASGKIKDVEVYPSPLEIDGRPYMYALIHDITPKKRAERSLAKAHAELESRVAERTLKLLDTNTALECEIEERKYVEAELKRSYSLLNAVIEGTDDAVFIKGKDGRYLMANSMSLKIIGKPRSEVIGKDDTEVFPEEIARKIKDFDLMVKRWGKTVVQEETMYLDGQEITLLTSKGPFRNEQGDIVGIFGVGRDITYLKKTEEALQKALKDKDLLLKEIHHRTKNNLSVIQSLLRLQAHQVTDKDAQAMLHQSRERLQALSMVHERLYKSDDYKSVDFGEYVRSLARALSGSDGKTRGVIKMTIDVPRASLDIDNVIPCGLIINELVTNSLKHAFPDGQKGEVKISFQKDPGGTCILEVNDNGVGLPDGFDQVRSTSLGLEIVSSLVAQLKGTFTIGPGSEGTTARVSFREYRP